jgi:hypothetical protein
MRSGSDDRPVTEDTEAEEGTEGWIGAPALVSSLFSVALNGRRRAAHDIFRGNF